MDKEMLLWKLKEYGESDFYPFHMPGHKRRELPDGFPGGFPNPYGIDITEIDGFDNLHHAEGILKESMESAARIYGADRTDYLVNGSTCGILSAICGLTDWGGRILMARNCHKAAYHGLLLNHLRAEYVYPEPIPEYGINGGIRAEDVRAVLERDAREHGKKDRIQAALVVSPTYEGVVSDIEAIAGVVHAFGIPLIVDEAHGAHLPFGAREGEFPKSALSCGADVVIQSLHKTLPCFTQTAVLHRKGSLAEGGRIGEYLSMFQTSSPSYLFLAAMDRCVRYMDGDGREEMKRYERRMKEFFHSLSGLRRLRVLGKECCGKNGVFDWDLSKIVVSVREGKGLSGDGLSRILRERYHLEMEMSGPEYVVAMTSLMDTEEGLLRLSEALREIDGGLEAGGRPEERSVGEPEGKTGEESKERSRGRRGEAFPVADVRLPLWEAMERPGRRVRLFEAAGRISKEFLYLYPPGIPLAAPGELLSEEITGKILEYQEAGLSVQGLSDSSLSTILTVAEPPDSVLE